MLTLQINYSKVSLKKRFYFTLFATAFFTVQYRYRCVLHISSLMHIMGRFSLTIGYIVGFLLPLTGRKVLCNTDLLSTNNAEIAWGPF